MLNRLKAQLSYANVMATVAVFIALGGSSYAATQLARNSVGSAQIRTKAVGSSELRSRAVTTSKIRSGAVTLTKINRSTRETLRGSAGQQGPAGPAGPSGVTYRAVVSSAGLLRGGNATENGTGKAGVGDYRVAFGRSMVGCTFTATLARVEGGGTVDPPAGRITVAEDSGKVAVRTYDVDGSARDLPFHLLAAC